MKLLEHTELSLKKHFLILQLVIGLVFALSFILIFALRNLDSVRNIAILLGEKIKSRPLNHNHWHEVLGNLRFTVLVSILFFDGFLSFILFRNRIEKSKKLQRLVLVTTVLFSAIFTLLVLDRGHYWGDDFSEYIAQARGIVTGGIAQQVENNSYIIKNSPPMYADAVYPWGFPFLLSPFYAMFGKDLFFLKIPVLLCFLIAILFSHLLFKKHFSFFQAELLTLFIAINPTLIFFSNRPLSDIPFFCFSTITIYALEGLLYKNDKKKQIIAGLYTGVFAFFSFMLRSNGLVFPCLFVVIR